MSRNERRIREEQRLDERLALLRDAPEPPEGLADRIMRSVDAVAASGAPSGRRAVPLAALLRSHLTTALAGAAVALAVVMAVRPGAPVPPALSVARLHAVRLRVAVPGARTVAVAGDWNGWSATASPLYDIDGDGVFAAELRLAPGSYRYMFVVDGTRWMTDPAAERRRGDDFGHEDAVLDLN